jgi:ATP-dependent DNA helicase RecG
MTPEKLQDKLNELLALPAETEWVEFKEAKNSFDFDDLGKYFSALSNEANLKNQECGWLLFGVEDKPRAVVGSQYRPSRPSLDSLKHEVANHTTSRMTFEDIHELSTPQGRVVLFQIPTALRGVPTAWKGHYYGRDGESLGALSAHEYEQIRGQAIQDDWSAQVCPKATLDDLDPDALLFARRQYKEKHPRHAEEVAHWDDLTFLNKAKVCLSGQITNTAIVLLGKDEAEHLVSPAVVHITWVLRDESGSAKDYQHFGPPLILAVDKVLDKIRNLTIRYLPSGTLFPREVSQYDVRVMREMLHNCIAHQDYTQAGRINIVEEPETLLFTNLGHFIPGSVEEVLRRDAPPEQYRNPFLAQAMVNLNMIDTIGSGIERMFTIQRQRFFPLPDYDLSDPKRVQTQLFGKLLDENYTQLLMEKTDLDVWDVIALDKVQKKRPLTDEEFKSLKNQKLVEGRRPNLYVSARVAAATGHKATYIKYRAFDKEHYKKMVLSYLEKFGEATREDINELLLDKLSAALNKEQKRNFVTNLLQEMKKERLIYTVGTTRWAKWRIYKSQ